MRFLVCLVIAQQATFSVRTEMVVLPVTVTDARGQSVAGLTPENFRVYDDDRLQLAPVPSSTGVATMMLPVTFIITSSSSTSPNRKRVSAFWVTSARQTRLPVIALAT
jgi:hypothetical protein